MDYINATDSELEQLVQQKDINAICELGERYLYGKNGHEKQYSLAYKMFHKGEKQGDKRAYKGLGDIYHNGWYMIKNEELAKEYYQKAGISVVPKDNPPQPQPQPNRSHNCRHSHQTEEEHRTGHLLSIRIHNCKAY